MWPRATLLPDGRVLITGNNPAELYNPVTDTFSVTGKMSTSAYRYGMYWHTSTLLPNQKVLVTGGTDEVGKFDSAELFDPASDTFTAIGGMAAPRELHTLYPPTQRHGFDHRRHNLAGRGKYRQVWRQSGQCGAL